MLTTNLKGTEPFLNDDELAAASDKASQSWEVIKNESGKGHEWLGWRRILDQPNDAELGQIADLAAKIREDADIFIVCGIGGSYLGARAVIEALTLFDANKGPEIRYAGHHMSGAYLESLMQELNEPKEDGSRKSVYLNVISKSGTTLETALAFRVLRNWMEETYEDASSRISCTTSEEGGALNVLVEEQGYEKFIIPDDVGGRFSVLTPVGLLPIAVSGIDIQTLFYGAVSKFKELEQNPAQVLDYAATRYALYQKGKIVDLFASFEPQLEFLGGWLQQLLGESEGKEGNGMFPVVAGYSTDLHSIGQMVQQGQRNLLETFLTVEDPLSDLTVPGADKNLDGLQYLEGRTFHDINSKAYEGTREAHIEGGVPVVSVNFKRLNAESLGEFIYFYELFTAVYVYCLEVNPFNQPGVEDYKKAMYRLLGKQ